MQELTKIEEILKNDPESEIPAQEELSKSIEKMECIMNSPMNKEDYEALQKLYTAAKGALEGLELIRKGFRMMKNQNKNVE